MTLKQAVAAPPRNEAHQCLVKACRDYLVAIGAWELKVMGGLGQRRGVPDLLACLRGRMIAIEVKTGAGRLTAPQQAERAALERAGCVYCLCRRIEDVEAALLEASLIAGRMLNR